MRRIIALLLFMASLTSFTMETHVDEGFTIASYNIGRLIFDFAAVYRYYEKTNDPNYKAFEQLKNILGEINTLESKLEKNKKLLAKKKNEEEKLQNDIKKLEEKNNIEAQEKIATLKDFQKKTAGLETKLKKLENQLTKLLSRKRDLFNIFDNIRNKKDEAIFQIILEKKPSVIFLQEIDCPISDKKNENSYRHSRGKLCLNRLVENGYNVYSSVPDNLCDVVIALKDSEWNYEGDIHVENDRLFGILAQHKLNKASFAFYNVHPQGYNLNHQNFTFCETKFPDFDQLGEQDYEAILANVKNYEKNTMETLKRDRTKASLEKLNVSMKAISALGTHFPIASGDFNVDPKKNPQAPEWFSGYKLWIPDSPTSIFIPLAEEKDLPELRYLTYFLAPRGIKIDTKAVLVLPALDQSQKPGSNIDQIIENSASDHQPVFGYVSVENNQVSTLTGGKHKSENCLLQ